MRELRTRRVGASGFLSSGRDPGGPFLLGEVGMKAAVPPVEGGMGRTGPLIVPVLGGGGGLGRWREGGRLRVGGGGAAPEVEGKLGGAGGGAVAGMEAGL